MSTAAATHSEKGRETAASAARRAKSKPPDPASESPVAEGMPRFLQRSGLTDGSAAQPPSSGSGGPRFLQRQPFDPTAEETEEPETLQLMPIDPAGSMPPEDETEKPEAVQLMPTAPAGGLPLDDQETGDRGPAGPMEEPEDSALPLFPSVQTQLTVGRRDDPFEREADSVAERVVRGESVAGTREDEEENRVDKLAVRRSPALQAGDRPNEELPVQRRARADPIAVRRTSAMPPSASGSTSPASGKNDGGDGASMASRISSPSAGRPLAPPLREDMESSFGADFSAVRIHDTRQDRADADELGARAFTHRSGIWLGPGSRADDRSLMAHELTHVLQQGAAVRRQPVDEAELQTTDPDRLETADTGSEAAEPSDPTEPAMALDGGLEDRTAPSESLSFTTDTPDIQAAWYNFDIPGTDYQFDPSIRGVKNAAGVAKDTVVESATWAKDKVVSGFEWVIEKIRGLVSGGIGWLNSKFEDIKKFSKTSFETVSNGLSNLLGFITAPANLLESAFKAMNADLLGSAWKALKTGAFLVWKGMRTTIEGVLKIGTGLWNTASGFVSNLFSTVDAIIDSWPFGQLPDFLQKEARGLVKKLRGLWNEIRNFITDLLKRLRKFVNDILDSVEGFWKKVISHGIQAVIDAVRAISEAWKFVKKIAADPIGYIRPMVDGLAAKANAEAPPKAVQIGEEKLRENFKAESSPGVGDVVVQRQPADEKPERTTASLDEVSDGFTGAISDAWSQLNIGDMLMTTIVNMFWPPATIKAIGHEFSELWTKDWANAASSLFPPRSIADDFFGFFHDIWSNILVLLDFPLALWRRLNSVLMLLLGWVTIILVFLGALAGGVLGVIFGGGAGAIPGAWAGAVAGLEYAATIGFVLLASYFAAEFITVVKSFTDLFTARQTPDEKERDYNQIAASLIGMGVAAVLVAVLHFLSSMIGSLVSKIRGGGPKAPAEPVKAAEPAKPTESVKPAEPPKPGEAAKSAEPAEPVKPVEPKPGEPGEPGEPGKPPVKEPKAEAPKKSEPVRAVEGEPGTFEVTDPSALKISEPSRLQGVGNKATWHWKLYVELPNGQTAVFCEVNIRPLISRGSPDLRLYPLESAVKGGGQVKLVKPTKSFSWTTESLRLINKSYAKKFGQAPKNLGGWLSAKNLAIFQEAFMKIGKSNPKWSIDQIAREAMKKTPFAKGRKPLGYTHFRVTILRLSRKTFPDGTTRIVPEWVRVEAMTDPVSLPKIPPIKPPEVPEGDKETGSEE